MIDIKIKSLGEDFTLLKKATPFAACWDVCASRIEFTSEDKVTVYLGFATEIPEGYKGVIVPRSSQNKYYWFMLNSPGQVDSDYRGEWQVKFTRIKPFEPFPFKVGDRVAQIYFTKIEDATFYVTRTLSETERGDGGFGSTGK